MSASTVFHVVVGAGPTGSATALLLAASGERVRVLSRSGRGPEHPLIERIAADATDVSRLVELTQGAATLFNCAMPAYDRWPTDWPPLAAALLGTAERTGARYVMLGNLYGYGPVDGPMTEDLPMAPSTVKGRVRARMWTDALAAHDAGRALVTEVRAADFLGPGAGSLFNFMVVPQVLAGEPAVYLGDLSAPRGWSYTGDVARTLVAAARSAESWGRAWHVPSTSTLSPRALAELLAELTGSPAPKLTRMSAAELHALGRENPILAEVEEMLYLMDSGPLSAERTMKTFDLTPTPVSTALLEMTAAHTRST
ncbi:NAD-dependent epimerase/dehydratase family protein [Embleya sp. NBC_00896]|uniref:NAD-dependent epimerase/dehydratase family protein n=1 Tax=Embleya sp. NBC_00896 TaxID=2975961 RepID=UPI00387050AA|nr:NAD-dependent epimerase/dehydratase family protein [Embleya sp. NBC_00896]